MKTNDTFALGVTGINKVCAAGEEYGRRCQKEGNVPVFSCEGGCIKGEIARQAANLVAKKEGYARACHGELFTVPHADLTKWVREAERVVLIDGCGLLCHGRIARNIIGKDRLFIFDALSIHKKYRDLMDIDDVPEKERKRAARKVAARVLSCLREGASCPSGRQSSCGCVREPKAETKCAA